MLAGLTAREAKVLRMRFGIDMNTDHTLEEVGKQFDVTRERIRQIEAKALRKLRHPSRSEVLRSFPGRLIGRPDQALRRTRHLSLCTNATFSVAFFIAHALPAPGPARDTLQPVSPVKRDLNRWDLAAPKSASNQW